jgi:hypothetical protein
MIVATLGAELGAVEFCCVWSLQYTVHPAPALVLLLTAVCIQYQQ